MKFTTSTLAAVGLAATASAETWSDWSSAETTSTATEKAAVTGDWPSEDPSWSTATGAAWSSTKDAASDWATTSKAATTAAWTCPAVSTVTSTKTETVYRSTVFVGPGPAETKTVYPSTCPVVGPTNNAPTWGPGKSSAVAPASSASATWSAGPWSSDKSSAVGPDSTTYVWHSTKTVTSTVEPAATSGWPAGGDGGNGGDWGTLSVASGTVVASGKNAGWAFTDKPKADPTTIAAPTPSGWADWSGPAGTLPEPGSDASNCTKAWGPLTGASCNNAGDRSKWCGKSINDDYYAADYSTGHLCSYELVITDGTYAGDGISRSSHLINGQMPGPLIECNWGDKIQITVVNKMNQFPTTIHWHGITQKGTNDQDGVPGVTECAIAPGSSRTYTFDAHQYGTGWYHSHVLAQLGDGIRGPMVIHGPATANYDLDMGTVMVDDLFGNYTNPLTAAQANDVIAHNGPGPTFNYLLNGANTSPDLKTGKHALWNVQPGKKHLFRFINSASQNMWSLHFDNHKMTVIATDYVPIVPYTTEWLNIAVGQRYDVIVEMNQPVAGYFLRAVTQTGCPSGSLNTGLGQANGIILYQGAAATLPTSTAGNKTVADFAFCADEPIASLVPWLKKTAGTPSAFGASASLLPAGNVAKVQTSDDGLVFRWFLNNGAININYTQPTLQTLGDGGAPNSSAISNPITLNVKGQWVYFVIQNQFFASHPIHLHGHDLSLLGQGTVNWSPALASTLNFVNPPRRDTALLVGSRGPGFPAGYTVIGFETDNPGAWLMHCHIVWHVDGGLALQWLERPSEIKPYSKSPAFQQECKAEKAYEAAGGKTKTSGESGLKRRTYFDQLLSARSEDVVRRSESAEKRYIDSYVKRGLGDGYKPRHGAHM